MKACNPLQQLVDRLQNASFNGIARHDCNRRSPSEQHASRPRQAAANLEWWVVAAALGEEGCSQAKVYGALVKLRQGAGRPQIQGGSDTMHAVLAAVLQSMT